MSLLTTPLLEKRQNFLTPQRASTMPFLFRQKAFLIKDPKPEIHPIFTLKGVLLSLPDYNTPIILNDSIRCATSNSRLLFLGREDGKIKAYNIDNKWEFLLEGHQNRVNCMQLTSDNQCLVTGSDDYTVKIWNLANQSLIVTLNGHSGEVLCVKITDDRKFIISSSFDRTIRIWKFGDWKNEIILRGHLNAVNCLELMKDTSNIVSGSWDGTLKVWSIKSKSLIATLSGHTDYINCVKITEDSKTIVSGSYDCTIRLWSTENWKEFSILEGHTHGVLRICLTQDNKFIISSSDDCTVRIWDIKTEKEISILQGHSNSVHCLSLSIDEKYIITGSWDNSIAIWSLTEHKLLSIFRGHSDSITCLLVDDHYIVSGSRDGTTQILLVEERHHISVLEGHREPVICFSIFEGNRYIVSGSWDNTLKIWDIIDGEEIHTLEGHLREVTCVELTKDGKYIVSGSLDKTIRVWNTSDYKLVALLEGHTHWIECLKITNDSSLIVSGSDDYSVRVWSIDTKSQVSILKGHSDIVNCLEIIDEKRIIVSASADKTIILWSLKDFCEIYTLTGHTQSIGAIQISHKGEFIVSGSRDNSVRIWSVEDFLEIAELDGHSDSVNCVRISSNDEFLASGSYDCTLRLWSLKEKKEIAVLEGHTKSVTCLEIAHDSKYILSGSHDKTIRLWSVAERNLVAILEGHSNKINCLQLTTNSKYAISGSRDRNLRVYDISQFTPSIYEYQELLLSGSHDPFSHFYFVQSLLDSNPKNISQLSLVTIFPLRINILHYYCFFDQIDNLKLALKINTPIFRDNNNKSPLSYAIIKKSRRCIDEILKYISEISDQKLLSECIHSIRDDIPSMLKLESPYILPFFKAIFKPGGKDLVEFAVPNAVLPIIYLSPVLRLYKNEFINEDWESGRELSLVQFWVSPLSWNLTMGSNESLKLLKAINECPSLEIFQAPWIQSIIKMKWDKLWFAILGNSCLYWMNLLLIILYLFYPYYIIPFLFIVVNELLLLYEVFQMYSNWSDYIYDVWNYIDIFRLALCFAWGAVDFWDVNFVPLTFLAVLVNFFRGLVYFRVFNMTRYYVRLIFIAGKESIAFLIIFLYSTLAFGVVYAATDPEMSLSDVWSQSYELNMGNFDNSGFSFFQYSCFTFASLINVVLMLNLLISTLGESFQKFKAIAMELDAKEMLQDVIEFESMMFWKRNEGERMYMQKCDHFQNISAESKLGSLSNKIDKLKHIVKQNEKLLRERFGLEESKILKTKLESKVNEMKQSIAELDKKNEKTLREIGLDIKDIQFGLEEKASQYKEREGDERISSLERRIEKIEEKIDKFDGTKVDKILKILEEMTKRSR
ncbi:unnamed protein product [Blepharisma stoltei]|uniref:Ion transport domain-containing protein n=1 Tax=Blepharisma stoltei TaxID=1481888 RepID=A0AAU9K174_9CILI|nr:unnamed protein product [Blepharisma stoltei]